MTDIIISEVAEYHGLTKNDLKQKTTKRKIVHPRHVSYYFIKKLTRLSFRSMASIYNQDHTSAMEGVKTIQDISSYDKNLVKDLLIMEKLIVHSINNTRGLVNTTFI